MRAPRWSTVLAYGGPGLALSAPTYLVQFYFLNFATDVLLMAPAVAGALFGACRLWDAISDPLAGYYSDRTRTRMGRRRPWMLVAAPGVALAFALLWSPARSLDSAALLAWLSLTLLLFFTATTAWGIPHQALGAELASEPGTRARIFGLRYVSSLFGVMLAFGGMQWIANAEDPRAFAASLGAGVGLASAALLLVPPLMLRESNLAASPRGEHVRLLPSFRRVLANRPARRLFFTWFFSCIATSAQGAAAPFMVLYLFRRPDLMGVLPAFFIGPLIASVPLWIVLARRIGQRRAWSGSLVLGAVAYASLFGLEPDDVVRAAAALALAGIATACSGPVGPSLLASVVDDDGHTHGDPMQGAFFAVWEFAEKAAGAVAVVALAAILELTGFVANALQDATAERGVRIAIALLPATMLVLAAVCLRGFDRELAGGSQS